MFRGAGAEDLKEPVRQAGVFQNQLEETKATAGIGMFCEAKQRFAQIEVIAEALRAVDKPEVELVFDRPQLGNEFGGVAFGIVDQIAGMDLEKLRQDQPGGVREVRARAAFDLRKIRLRYRCLQVLLYGPDNFLLSHRPVEAPECALDFPEITDLLAQFHIAI